MSGDIEKLAVFDDRIVQSRPKYAVEKGALSVTNSPFNAIAANSSQHTYNVLVPSENVFIDRSVDWTSTCFCQATVTLSAALTVPGGATQVLATIGKNCALAAFPLQTLTTTMTATINDTTVTINSQDVLPQVLRMTDYKKNRVIRTCPTMMDRYVKYSDATNGNSPLNSYSYAWNADEVPNGAFPGFAWTDANGIPLTAAGNYTAPSGWTSTNAAPVPALPPNTYNQNATFTVYFKFTSTEKLVLSPFVFSDIHEWDTGLFGCQNIQLVMNLQAPSRVLRATPLVPTANVAATLTLSNVQYNLSASAGQQAFTNSRVNIQFLTPSLDVPLPPKSVVPYMEFPRYISGQLAPLGPQLPGAPGVTYSSQTITLPQIPDLLIIYAKPQGGYNVGGSPAANPDLNQGDWMLPISNISVNFDNFAGLLSAHTQQQLYKMSVHNGLEQDWASWSGLGYTENPSVPGVQAALVGGMLVLKPGRDIVLQAGQAPSLVGNFVLQFNITLNNYSDSQVTPQLFVITANSGFFETIKGSSRVVKGVLTEQDIISAPVAPGGTVGSLRRAVGGSVLGSLGNALSRVKGMFHQGGAPAASKQMDMSQKMPGSKVASKSMANSLSGRLM